MSYTEIYGVKTNGEVVFVDEVRNAFAGAFHVWQSLADAYGIQGGMLGGFNQLWKMADKGVLKDFENITMKATFDNVVVKKEDVPNLLQAFKEYDKTYPNSNLPEQARIISEEILLDEDFIGVCWNQTSVNSNPWVEGYDVEMDEEIPYNVLNGKRHWFL